MSSNIKLIKNRKKNKVYDIYHNVIISKISYIPIVNVGSNIKSTLEKDISSQIEAKCISEGYIKPDSVKII